MARAPRGRPPAAVALLTAALLRGAAGLPVVTTEEIACRGRELGVPWLRVRSHLQGLFAVDPTGAEGLQAFEAAAAVALSALGADAAVPSAALKRLLTGRASAEGVALRRVILGAGGEEDLEDEGPTLGEEGEEEPVGCAVGLAALRLLRCVGESIERRPSWCSPDDLDWDLLIALGVVGTTPMGTRVRGSWPVHALVAALVERHRQDASPSVEEGGLGDQGSSGQESQMRWARDLGDRLLAAVRELDAQPSRRSSSSPERVATATLMAVAKREACGVSAGVLRSCPYRPPLDTILCGRGVASSTIRWGTYPTMCLDVQGGSPVDRTSIQLWTCKPDSDHPNHRFLTPAGGKGTIRWATHPQKCLDVKQGGADNKNVVQLFQCTKNGKHPNQQFLLPTGPEGPIRWATHPEFCLDIKGGDMVNGSKVQLFKCAQDYAHPNQQFIVPPADQGDACGGGFSGGGRLAAASALVVLAAWGTGLPPTRIGGAQGGDSVGSCRGLQRLCGAAFGSNSSDPIWSEARSAVEEGVTSIGAGPVLTVLAASPWPVAHLLAALSSAFRRRRQEINPPLPADTGACACDMGNWPMSEARAVAAAIRVLETLGEQGEFVEQPLAAVLSPDGAAACDIPWELRVIEASFVAEVWETELKLGEEGSSSPARRFRDAEPLSWDTAVCLPGVAALGMICSTRALALNQPDALITHTPRIRAILKALSNCVEIEPQDAFLHFMGDWAVLAPWLLDTSSFFDSVQSRAIANTSWWLGANSQLQSDDDLQGGRMLSGALRRSAASPDAADACSGVWGAGPEHPCRRASRAEAPQGTDPPRDGPQEPGAAPRPNGVPASLILGVGLMKAGSTAVWQALGAATQLSMGLDCSAAGTTALPLEAARRRAPLEAVVDACYGELLRWELAKDPLLTPVARRLADAWPALSSHGGPLRLYFVVRSPFECARSLIEHLKLRTRVETAEEQRFSWQQGRFPEHFTPGKQRYLDITAEGLNYSGYVDAAVQRWALVVDEYLACPSRFVLVRYEDFVADPVGETRRLLADLGLPELWRQGAEARVREAAAVQYQTPGRAAGRRPEEVFGRTQAVRMASALQSRLELLGYDLGGGLAADIQPGLPSIDMPPMPARAC